MDGIFQGVGKDNRQFALVYRQRIGQGDLRFHSYVWVTADQKVKVYWPYPEGTDKNTEFFVVHYRDLDRQYDEDLSEKVYDTVLYAADAQTDELPLENTDEGILFTVDSFSPFALFWTEDDGPSDPTPGPGPDPEEPEDPSGTPDNPDTPETPDTPNTPNTPDQPNLPDVSNGAKAPSTGDPSVAGLWLLLGISALVGLLLLGGKRLFLRKYFQK